MRAGDALYTPPERCVVHSYTAGQVTAALRSISCRRGHLDVCRCCLSRAKKHVLRVTRARERVGL
jgi:hypothetical protein